MCDGNLRMAECLENVPEPYEYFKAIGLDDNEAIIAEFLIMQTNLNAEQVVSCIRGESKLEAYFKIKSIRKESYYMVRIKSGLGLDPDPNKFKPNPNSFSPMYWDGAMFWDHDELSLSEKEVDINDIIEL